MLAEFPYENLLEWHRKFGRHDLPWRKNLADFDEKSRSYRVWLSEILLQQTQAPRVVPFFNRMVERFPTVESLAEADFETFFPYYDGLGYYSRARNMLAAAKTVSEKFSWTFPSDSRSLVSLPWVWPYTAEAIRAFAYGLPTLPFDTNLEKVFSRYYFGTRFRKLSAEEKKDIAEDFARSGFDARTISWALMDFANVVSNNSLGKIDWADYPLPGCRFFETRWSLEIRPKKGADRFPMKDSVLVAVLFDHSGNVLYWAEGSAYSPFFIDPTEGDPRAAIKERFLKSGIAVSVRPPYSKGFLDGAPLAFFRCRVQTGETSGFETFPTDEFGKWWGAESAEKEIDFAVPPK